MSNSEITGGVTLLDRFIQNKGKSNACFVVDGYGYPSDGPLKSQGEGYVQFLRGSYGNRTVVLYWTYGSVGDGSILWRRTIFNNAWRTSWEKLL